MTQVCLEMGTDTSEQRQPGADIGDRLINLEWCHMILIDFLLCSVITTAGFATAPDVLYRDVVLLNNGAIVIGRILEQESGKDIQIENSNKIIVDIPRKKIALITTTFSDYETRHRQILDSLAAGRTPDWAYQQLEILRVGAASGSSGMFSASGTVATEGFKGFYIGLGAGVDRHSTGTFLPVTAEMGFILSQDTPQLSLALKAGFALGWLDSQQGSDYGGARFGFGLGLSFPAGNDVNLFGEIGYVQQQVNKPNSLISTLDFLSINFGIEFGKL